MRNYIFIPKISVSPNKVAVFNEVSWYGKMTAAEKREQNRILHGDEVVAPAEPKPILEKKFHNFDISENGQRTIKQKITWLYHLSKSRYIKTYSGKEIFNFKMNFITLTLPSSQTHPTSEITTKCFNQFITEIRQRTGMENYVWRLEFQANGNVHYHIASDCYIDFFFARSIWNRIINKLDYVDSYQSQMSSLTLNDYFLKYQKNGHADFPALAKRYAKGKAENWSNPPSVDVKNCTSAASIANYIAKYFSKAEKSGCKCNPLDNAENSFGLRLWFCSRSLSKLKTVVEYLEVANFRADILLDAAVNVKVYFAKYAKMYYFNLRKLSNYIKAELYQYLKTYADALDYHPAGSTIYISSV